jgi:hypothetical protein
MFLTSKKSKKLYLDKKDNLFFFVCVFVDYTEEEKIGLRARSLAAKSCTKITKTSFFTAPGHAHKYTHF